MLSSCAAAGTQALIPAQRCPLSAGHGPNPTALHCWGASWGCGFHSACTPFSHLKIRAALLSSKLYTQNPFLLKFLWHYSTPSAASPASPAPTPACLQSPSLVSSSPPSPWQLISCSWWTLMPSLMLQAYATFFLFHAVAFLGKIPSLCLIRSTLCKP